MNGARWGEEGKTDDGAAKDEYYKNSFTSCFLGAHVAPAIYDRPASSIDDSGLNELDGRQLTMLSGV